MAHGQLHTRPTASHETYEGSRRATKTYGSSEIYSPRDIKPKTSYSTYGGLQRPTEAYNELQRPARPGLWRQRDIKLMETHGAIQAPGEAGAEHGSLVYKNIEFQCLPPKPN